MDHSVPDIVGNHYSLEEKLGEGSFGIIYEGVDLRNDQRIAVKLEPRVAEKPMLRDEYLIYKAMEGIEGVPLVYYFGQEGSNSVLVMDLLGPSLEDLFERCEKTFSVKTVAMVGIKMLGLLQSVHERNYIFRDVKPDNFLIGANLEDSDKVYLIDFGMAKTYRNPITTVHIPFREVKGFSGTARYMSINTHLGIEQSRRDDLESLGYVLLYFLRGALPWQGLKAANNKQKYEKICKKKMQAQLNELCCGYPDEFGVYLQYARQLKFDEQPNYDFCHDLFMNALKKSDGINDGIYDWMLLNNGKGWKATGRKRPRVPLLLMDK